MTSTPRSALDDSYTLGISCAICGSDALSVNHVPNLPDYVGCTECSSAFLVEEGGDRVFYGQIAPGFDDTERFALRQWAWLEAVATRARQERSSTAVAEETPAEEPAPQSQLPDDIEPAASEGLTADEWISSEIPFDDLLAASEDHNPLETSEPDEGEHILDDQVELPIEPQDLLDDKVELPQDSPSSLSPFELEDDDDTGLPDAEDRGLADFFDALTDDTGEVTPIAEPDEYLAANDEPIASTIDPDLMRLMETEDDSGPDLPPPPWSSTASEPTPVADPDGEPMGPTSWHEDELDALDDDDAIPVVDAKDETYESLPAWTALADSTPIEDDSAGQQLPNWGAAADNEAGEGPIDWNALEALDGSQAPADTPEAPDWALPEDDRVLESPAEEAQSWSADESAPSWLGTDSGLADQYSEDDDFLADLRRSAAVPLESKPVSDTPLSGLGGEDSDWDIESNEFSARMESVSQPIERPGRVAPGWEMTAAAASVSAAPEPEDVEELDPAYEGEADLYVPPASDPAPGQRFRVVIRGERVVFPGGDCAHCGSTPVKGKLAVAGTLPRGQNLGQRRPTRFEVPLCASCRSRAAAKSDEAQAAQLQAHLISGIIGMVLVVGALALDIINPRDLGLVDLFLGLILLIVGYGGPAFFLLNRVGNALPPVDARYVRTTLLIPSETQGLETAFEWRNNEYARRFHEANHASVLGNVTDIKDRIG